MFHGERSQRGCPGLLVIGRDLRLYYANDKAVRILTGMAPGGPVQVAKQALTERIREALSLGRSSGVPSFVAEFASGSEVYRCSAIPLNRLSRNSVPPETIALLLEPKVNAGDELKRIAQAFRLSEREQETLGHLARGKSTKEIASLMAISPSTVKSFVHLISVKMGVATRAEVLAKILGSGR